MTTGNKNPERQSIYKPKSFDVYTKKHTLTAYMGAKTLKKWARHLLASQFVSSLCTKIKKCVTGSDQPDIIEQLLVKARFEEGKQADLVVTEMHSQMDRSRDPPPLRLSHNLSRPW